MRYQMKRYNEQVRAILELLQSLNISASVEQGKKCHIKITWQLPSKPKRMVVCSHTPSKPHAMNEAVRLTKRILREDGVVI